MKFATYVLGCYGTTLKEVLYYPKMVSIPFLVQVTREEQNGHREAGCLNFYLLSEERNVFVQVVWVMLKGGACHAEWQSLAII